MEITSIAPERNDEGNCRLDSCAGHVELFFLDRWRHGAVDSTLRGKELHRLLGSLCFHKQSSKGRKKIFLNSLRQVCCVRKQHCVITFIQFCESPVVCIFAFLCMRVVMEDTVYFYAFLRALAVWPFWVSRGMRANRGPEAPTFHVLLIYSPPSLQLLLFLKSHLPPFPIPPATVFTNQTPPSTILMGTETTTTDIRKGMVLAGLPSWTG